MDRFCIQSTVFLLFFIGLLGFTDSSGRLGCYIPLGMQSGKIKDNQISAYTSESGWEPYEGRLNNNGAWCSDGNEKGQEYFQVDLNRVRHVSEIGIQGVVHYFIRNYFVKTYKVKYSFDGKTWHWFKVWDDSADDYAVKTFTGNSDSVNTEIKSRFRDSFVTRYIRLYPVEYKSDMCIRAEMYGCSDEKDNCLSFITSPAGNITSPNYPRNYSQGSDCTWIISVDKKRKVTLLVRDFDIGKPHNQSQCEDILQIYDGPLDRSKLLGSYCNGLEVPLVVQSSNSTMRLRFYSKVNGNPRKGFKIQYLATSGDDDVYTATACEGNQLYLSCMWNSYTINIIHVFYGSYPHSPVCHGVNVASSTCSSSSAETSVKSHCQHFKSCNITVNKGRFGQPCADGVIPQLQVYYQCTSSTFKTTTPSPTTADLVSQVPGSIAPSPFLPHPTPVNRTVLYVTIDRTATEEPSVLVSSTIALETTTTPSENNTAVGDGGNTAGRKGIGNDEIVIIAAALSSFAVVAAVLAVVCLVCKRRRKRKHPPNVAIELTAAKAATENPPNRANLYDSVNLLYESGGPDKPSAAEPVYETADVNAKVSDNLLYESSEKTPTGDYDEPVSVPTPKPQKKISITNPGYGRTIEFNQVPQYEKMDP